MTVSEIFDICNFDRESNITLCKVNDWKIPTDAVTSAVEGTLKKPEAVAATGTLKKSKTKKAKPERDPNCLKRPADYDEFWYEDEGEWYNEYDDNLEEGQYYEEIPEEDGYPKPDLSEVESDEIDEAAPQPKAEIKPLLLLPIQARQPQRKQRRRLRRMQRTCWVVRWRWAEGSLEPPLASSPSSSKSKIQRLHSQDSNHHNQLCKKDQDHKLLNRDQDHKLHNKDKDPRFHNRDRGRKVLSKDKDHKVPNRVKGHKDLSKDKDPKVHSKVKDHKDPNKDKDRKVRNRPRDHKGPDCKVQDHKVHSKANRGPKIHSKDRDQELPCKSKLPSKVSRARIRAVQMRRPRAHTQL